MTATDRKAELNRKIQQLANALAAARFETQEAHRIAGGLRNTIAQQAQALTAKDKVIAELEERERLYEAAWEHQLERTMRLEAWLLHLENAWHRRLRRAVRQLFRSPKPHGKETTPS